MKIRLLSAALLAITGAAVALPAAASGEVNVYSARKEALIKPLLDRFTAESGITVNLVTGKADALLKRLKSEGRNTPADLFITTDAGRLHRAKEAGVLQSVSSDALAAAVPASYRDPAGEWYGLSLRARTVVYAKDRVDPATLNDYASLADPQWKRKVCVRSSGNIYNQSLVAAMVANQGADATQQWAEGFVANFARPPKGGDRDQIKAVAAGQCDVALVNSYYFGAMIHAKDEAQRAAAAKVAVAWPDKSGSGVHLNVSGAGVTKAAKNRDAAVKLLEFLATEQSQKWYAEVNHEYPVRAGVEPSATLKGWGEFRADNLNLAKLGEHNPNAVRIMDRAGWK